MYEMWDLKEGSNINQMLRVRRDIKDKKGLNSLLIIKHEYHISDDVMFPDPSCLAFFTAFEENHLLIKEEERKIKLVAIDIFQGQLKYYVYCQDAKETIYYCIDFLKSNPNYKVEFEIKEDSSWKEFEEL